MKNLSMKSIQVEKKYQYSTVFIFLQILKEENGNVRKKIWNLIFKQFVQISLKCYLGQGSFRCR